MSTKVALIEPSLPSPTTDPNSMVQAILAIKNNIEAHNQAPRSRPRSINTPVNTYVNAALRAVTKASPF
jgi:nitrogen-specific signal transduction histidine kinase